jgi:uncharacterized protein (DUF1697 family)
MTIRIALLRAVNVAGRQPVAMSGLRDLGTALGLEDVRSLLQSGNLVFRSDARSSAGLEGLLEAEAARRLDLRTEFLVRSAKELAEIIANNPFRVEAARDPGHLVVMFLKDAPAAKNVDDLRAAISGREIVAAAGKQLYVVYPDGIGRSRLTSALIERKLGTRGTGRNWNTVLKLAALAKATQSPTSSCAKPASNQSEKRASHKSAKRASNKSAKRASGPKGRPETS